MRSKLNAFSVFVLTIAPFVTCQQRNVTMQEVAAKVKNVAMDIKDSVAATSSTTQVKQFAEVVTGFKTDVVDMFSDDDGDIVDAVDEFTDTLKPLIQDLLNLEVTKTGNENRMEDIDLIREVLDATAMTVSIFVKKIQAIFNAKDEEVPWIADLHLVNLMEIQHRTRRARLRLSQLGGFGR